MNINIKFLEKELVGTTVSKPLSGTLSGHAAGEPFDKHAYRFIKERYAGKTFRQYEFLNKLYSDNPKAIFVSDRRGLIKIPALALLLNRGKDATEEWSVSNLFVEKQNDTADILVTEKSFFNLIDVKTYNIAKNGQPPNIISAYKLAKMCALMLDTSDFSSHDISYVGITWKIDGENLKCTRASVKQLFKTDPAKLYINWSAAMQIQFHVEALDQSYNGTVEQWCKDYLLTFVAQAKGRAKIMLRRFVKPFERFLK
ncbi:restriction endonuclease [Candidatus Jorgensenbacteria bacterium GWC1_48_12]|uniref:Restriction endonuclease n=2 Tax=Patescibacteria group TaxID=1783273 RepID=A0A1F6BRJ9_9BACT|nr:MAG: Restriction endonuclease HincII [Candidatus Woesebacteria bacterium GW2011_GWB1_38_8]OGG39554.1 MAG: restriction endonuclease [Candidatus Jorgensenbacteria bacterium GWC1_48_12]